MTRHVYGLGSAGNVRPTCNGHGQDQRVTAYARSQVYTADKARRDIGELDGTEGHEMECYVEAQGARS